MHDEWQQTDQIVMSVQTAELRQAGVNQSPTLNLSCSLVNIARGQCQLELAAGEADKKEDIGNFIRLAQKYLVRLMQKLMQNLFQLLTLSGNL